MSDVLDLFQVYQFITRLSKPFKETTAFELGLIDEKGKLLKKPSTRDEKSAYNPYNRMIFNLKRLLNKLPGMENRFATFAAALYLLKEEKEETTLWDFKQYMAKNRYEIRSLMEEVAVNNVGGSNIAGAAPGEDPPIRKRLLSKYKKKNKKEAGEVGRKLFAQIREQP